MELTDDELDALYACVYDEVFYGDDDVVYGEGEYAVNLRAGWVKLNEEIKRRKLY